jgi:hypothetical protein
MSLLTIWHKDIITLANLVLIFFAVHVWWCKVFL